MAAFLLAFTARAAALDGVPPVRPPGPGPVQRPATAAEETAGQPETPSPVVPADGLPAIPPGGGPARRNVAAPPGGGRTDPWSAPVRLHVWGQPLDEARRQLSRSEADLNLVASLSVSPPGPEGLRPLYLVADEVPCRTALEMLALALGARYYLEAPGQARLVSGYEWLDARGREAPVVYRRPRPREAWLAPGEAPALADARLAELARAVPLFDHERCAWRIHEIPVGGADDTVSELEGVLPPTARRLLDQALALAEGPAPDWPLPPPRPAPPAAAAEADRLDRPVIADYDRRPLDEILADLSLQARLAVGFDHAPFEAGPPPAVSLRMGHVTAREAFLELARQLGLRGAYSPCPGVVWLASEGAGWQERPRESRELLWHSLAAGAHAAGPALGHGPGRRAAPPPGWPEATGDLLAGRLRRTVDPGVWKDPMAVLVYNPRQDSLVAIAPAETHEGLERELRRLAGAMAEDSHWPAE